MSDYAGPILGTVGAVIGNTIAPGIGAQWGWAIGSAIGGMYAQSQQVIPGPKIGEVARQTSQEGGFRPIVYGRSQPIAGNVIADGGPKIVPRRERQGKGGPKVETESAYRTYAVGFCEGWAELLQAWRNGILVYDAEDPSMAAENEKFLEYATWYPGTFDQPASPDLEEIYGVGQAPYFRGTAYLSLHNEDVTDQRGAWSQWQVRVNTQPPEAYLTSKPYTQYFADDAQTRPLFGEASTRPLLIIHNVEPENVSIDRQFYGASTREAQWVWVQEPERGEMAPLFFEASTKNALVSHTQLPEDFATSEPVFVSAMTKDVLLTNEMQDEFITTQPLFIGASTS